MLLYREKNCTLMLMDHSSASSSALAFPSLSEPIVSGHTGTHTDTHYATHLSHIETLSSIFKDKVRNIISKSTVTSHSATTAVNQHKQLLFSNILTIETLCCNSTNNAIRQRTKSNHQPTFCRATFNSHSVVKNSSSDRAGICS